MSRQPENSPIQITIVGRNMPATEPLRLHVVKKMDKLTRYVDRLSMVDVVLTATNNKESSSRHSAEATATAGGLTVRAVCTDTDVYTAIDGLVDKLHMQLTRTKERVRDNKHRGHGVGLGGLATGHDDGGADLSEPQDDAAGPSADSVVEVKQYTMKPIFSEEAIDEMNELGHAFFVFLNAKTEKVSVVYRRRDGQYGLIEPAFA
jgi:putative sigma-54 modulation protein